ncbi:hypothetical protein ACOMHN_061117 [Nucella lapillus]
MKNWRDKLELLRNKEFRNRLDEAGVRLANDLTRRQAEIVAQAKKENKVAFFSKGKLIVTDKPAEDTRRRQIERDVTQHSHTAEPQSDPTGSDDANRVGVTTTREQRGPVPGTATPRLSPRHDAVRVDPSPRDERRNAKLPAGPRGDRGGDSRDNRRAGRNTTKQPLAKQTNMRGYLQGQTPAGAPRNPRTLRSNVTGP